MHDIYHEHALRRSIEFFTQHARTGIATFHTSLVRLALAMSRLIAAVMYSSTRVLVAAAFHPSVPPQ